MAKWKRIKKTKVLKTGKHKRKTQRVNKTSWDSVKNNIPIIYNSSDTYKSSLIINKPKYLTNIQSIINRKKYRKQQRINRKIYNACINVSGINVPLFHVNNANTQQHRDLYSNIFAKLNTYYQMCSQPNENWQFIEYYFYLNEDGKYCIQIASPFVEGHQQTLKTGLQPLPHDITLITELEQHIEKIIGDSNLGAYIKTLIENKYIVRIAMDFYTGRPISKNLFHKDTREGVGFYACLTFDIDETQRIPGPELTHYNIYCENKDALMKRQVIRPILYGAYAQIGFNDPILIHSTPYSGTAEDENGLFDDNYFIPVEILPSYVELEHYGVSERAKYGSMRVKSSKNRIRYEPTSNTRPDFLRCWFESFSPTEQGTLDTTIINKFIYGNSTSNKVYSIVCYDSDGINFILKPNTHVKNITEYAPYITSLENLQPSHLNNIFEEVCERVDNMG